MMRRTKNLIGPIQDLTEKEARRCWEVYRDGIPLHKVRRGVYRKFFAEGDEPTDNDDDMYVSLGWAPHRYSFGFIVHGKIYKDFLGNEELHRLAGVKQLGIHSSNPHYSYATHTRLFHSVITAIMMEYALSNNGYDGLIDLGVASSLLHDIATPPLSEQGKLGSGGLLDEEKNIAYFLAKPGILQLLERYRLEGDNILNCVRGVYPVIGPLLKSEDCLDLDRVAYTSLDASLTYGVRPVGEMKRPLRQEHLFDIYKDIAIVDGNPAFKNPKRLSNFLMARAVMHERIYDNPWVRAKWAFFGREMKRLWKAGILTREKMLSMDDSGFETFLKDHLPGRLHCEFFNPVCFNFSEVRRVYGTDIEGVREKYEHGDVIVEQQYPFNPATSTLVATRKGPKKFRDAFPEKTERLEEIAGKCKYVGVYKYDKCGGPATVLLHPTTLIPRIKRIIR